MKPEETTVCPRDRKSNTPTPDVSSSSARLYEFESCRVSGNLFPPCTGSGGEFKGLNNWCSLKRNWLEWNGLT